MKIADVNVSVGGRDASGKIVTKEALLEMMNDYHIDYAVASHQHALLDPKDGNGKMIDLAADSGGKLGVCAVVDPILGKENMPGEGSLVKRLRDAKVECLRVCPEQIKMVFHPFYWEEILNAANELGLPLIIDEDYTGEFFIRFLEIAYAYLDVKFILIRCGLWKGRYIFPLLVRCKNVYFTVEHMLDYKQIEEISEKAGCDQLLFGSGYPRFPVSGALGLAIYADISEEAREKILCKNWERIKL